MADPAKPKDRWDKVGIFLHPMGGLLTAVAVAVVGVKGSQVIDRRQSLDTNSRLYSELMSRREESESSLRKDMFVSIITSFLQPSSQADLDAKVLNLELLAYNFHDSLDLRPLFLDLQRRIRRSKDPDRKDYLLRINKVAREITAKQLFSLEGHGKSFRRTVDLTALPKPGRGSLALDPEHVALRDVSCDINLRVLSADVDQQQVTVRLEAKAPEDRPDLPDTRATFDVGFFDFPMIDNTRLANGLRCAVTLAAFSPEAADLVTVCYPGEYASLKDRPYYDEVIQKLREADEEERGVRRAPAAPAH